MSDKTELRHKRSQRFHDAVDFKKTDRIPTLACVVAWKILDAGYRFPDAFYDWETMEKCVRHFAQTYAADCITDPGAGTAYRLMRAFGQEQYYSCSDHRIDVEPFSLAEPCELQSYFEDRSGFLYSTLFPRKFSAWERLTVGDLQRALDETANMRAYAARITGALKNEYGMPLLSSTKWGAPTPVIEQLTHPVRGIRGLSRDIHRCPELIDDIVGEFDASALKNVVSSLETGEEGHDLDFCFDMRTVIRSSCVLNAKQFERWYWKSMKPVFDACAGAGKHMLVMVEGPGEHIYDLFEDLPKGAFAFMIEHDDPFEFRKRLPNAAIVGGMPVYTLGHAGKDECIGHVRRLVEGLGQEGGYVFAENNFMCYPNDATSENMRAVYDYLAGGLE